jgi:SUMO ligase MMS21 Smc5/6 complex component
MEMEKKVLEACIEKYKNYIKETKKWRESTIAELLETSDKHIIGWQRRIDSAQSHLARLNGTDSELNAPE